MNIVLITMLLASFISEHKMSDSISDATAQKTKTANQSATRSRMQIHGGCIYVLPASNAQSVSFGNACNQVLQFTVKWSGVKPPQSITYRINNRGLRNVSKRDKQGAVVAEEPVKPGGPSGRFKIEDTDAGEGQHLLLLINLDSVPIFVHGHIKIFENGKEVQDCQPDQLVDKNGRNRACVFFNAQTFEASLQAEQDPD